ncbi:unnamed protein product [Scytosiphon promiscuus]
MDQQRRRRMRPAPVWQSRKQKAMLCACLGLGAHTIVPTTEAWVPAGPLLQGRGPSGSPVTAAGTTAAMRGAFPRRPLYRGDENRWARQQQRQRQERLRGARVATSALAAAGTSGGEIGGRAWGTATATATATGLSVFRRQSASAPSSRSSSSWPGRPVASASAGGRRGGVAVMMSMAEEDGGAESGGYNPVLGALALAGLGAIYYGLHDHSGGAAAVSGGGLAGLGADTGGAGAALSVYSGSLTAALETAKAGPSEIAASVQEFLASSVTKIEGLGPVGALYFGLLYVLAEVLIIPAIPLTTAAGFLFGVAGGTAVVLSSATVAAAISFQLGRTLLRQQVEGLLDENPKFRALDAAIAREGFKVILLLRLSPIFPFALSNYLYGVTSVDFLEYMMGTLIGFFPGTLAYVYGGTVGKAMTDGEGMGLPWYGYAVGAAFVAFLLKTVGDIATTAIEEMEETDP